MVRRFQIEDMMTQDASGVVFRALDTETGLRVAVRRFFPFGLTGGGLNDDEQSDYRVAVEKLTGVSHPAMRSIIAGGCDPVDGMPFIATEWIEGIALQTVLEQGPLSAANAIGVLNLALEVCGQISQVLGEEAVWIEADIHTIIVGAQDEARGVTFWISPLKWLGKNDGQRGLTALADLTEDIMGWRGKRIHDHQGEGLGGWLKWLRAAPHSISLDQAREKLWTLSGTPPPAPVRRPARPPARTPRPSTARRKTGLSFLIGGTLSLATIAFGGWSLIQWNNARLKAAADSILKSTAPEVARIPDKPAAETSPGIEENSPAPQASPARSRSQIQERTPEQIRLEAMEFSAAARKTEQAKAQQIAEIAKRDGVHHLDDSDLLLERVGDVVTLEGTLEAVEQSGKGKGKTIYLIFAGAEGKGRGGVETSKARGELAEAALSGLVGKRLRIKGKVRADGFGRVKIPVVMITDRRAIEPAP